MRITSTGAVGIGTTAPTAKLEVAGEISAGSYEVVDADGGTLTAQQVRGTVVTNYGASGAATFKLPDAPATGYNVLFTVGTDQEFRVEPFDDADDLYFDGTLIDDGDYVTNGAGAIGDALACYTSKTGASAWTWFCKTVSGTWTREP